MLKKILFNTLDLIKFIIGCRNLSEKENSGYIDRYTSLHFFPKTKIILPFELGRTIRGVSFKDCLDNDPFGRMIVDMVKGVSEERLIKNLYIEYLKESSLYASDVVGLPGNYTLTKYPPWTLVMPWEKQTIQDRYKKYRKVFVKNRSENGLVSYDNNFHFSDKDFYMENVVVSQVKQSIRLFKSLKKHGLMHTDSLPIVHMIIDSNKWRWIMGDEGNHRAYILFAMGYKTFEVRISSVIKKSDANNWFNVRNNLYSNLEARVLFDNMFSGCKAFRGLV